MSRDAPSVIRARVRTVSVSTFLCCAATYFWMVYKANFLPLEALRLLGWWPVGVLEVGRGVLLTVLLFMGPLFERAIVDGEWKSWIRGGRVVESLSGWIGWRNYVAVRLPPRQSYFPTLTQNQGTYNGGGHFSFAYCPTASAGPSFANPNRIHHASLLWHSPCPASVRISTDPSRRGLGSVTAPNRRPILLHDCVWVVCDLPLPADRFSPRCRHGTRFLQLLRRATILGASGREHPHREHRHQG